MKELKIALYKKLYDKENERESTRDGFGKALLEIGKDKKVMALSADLEDSTRVHWFKEKHPERFFEVGVAEQNMAGVAAGLALMGKIPFMASFAAFSPGRNWDQIRVSICYNQANVKIASTHAGLTVGEDGATHQALEDIAMMRALPKMAVVVPCDFEEAKKATKAAYKHEGACYLRLGREKMPQVTDEKTPFKLGKIEGFKGGKDVAIIACGSMVHESMVAAKELEKQGISPSVFNCHTIKPLDLETLNKIAKEHAIILTAEEHQIAGGMGSAVCEALSECKVFIKKIGMQDSFGESGNSFELLKKYGLTSERIKQEILNLKHLLKREEEPAREAKAEEKKGRVEIKKAVQITKPEKRELKKGVKPKPSKPARKAKAKLKPVIKSKPVKAKSKKKKK